MNDDFLEPAPQDGEDPNPDNRTCGYCGRALWKSHTDCKVEDEPEPTHNWRTPMNGGRTYSPPSTRDDKDLMAERLEDQGRY